MKPLAFVIFQLVVLGFALVVYIRKDPSTAYRLLWLAAYAGVIGMDVWYLSTYAYPAGFTL